MYFSFFICSIGINLSTDFDKKKSIIANIMKTQIFHKIWHDLKGHSRSYKTTFMPKSF